LPDNEEEGFRVHRLDPQAIPDGPTFHSIAQRHKRGVVEREWLIENLLPRRCVAILSGWSSVGKTHVVNDLMLSCAFGMPFAGMAVKRACGAVLFAAEGQDDVVPRWDVIEYAKIKPHLEQLGLADNTPYPLHWADEVPRLTSPDAYDQYAKALERLTKQQRTLMLTQDRGLGLVAIDTMAASCDFPQDQANSAGANQVVFNILHRLAKTFDCCVMVVDHLGKDATRGTRGSNAKEASADVVLRLTGTVTEDGPVLNTAMTIAKLRGGASGRRLPFKLKVVKMPRLKLDGVVVQWDATGEGSVAKQNRRHPMLMHAIDAAIDERFQWIRLGHNMNFKGVESWSIYDKFKLSYCATAEGGVQRENTIRKAYNRAMKDSSEMQLIGQKTMANKSVVVWRTDYKFGDTSTVSPDEAS
jgi:RecA-family ATPase